MRVDSPKSTRFFVIMIERVKIEKFSVCPYTSYLTDDIQLNHGRPSPKGRPLYQRIHHSNSNQ